MIYEHGSTEVVRCDHNVTWLHLAQSSRTYILFSDP